MSNTFLPILGGCRCDRVRLQIASPAIITMACHCTGCQRMTASAFSLSTVFASDAFSVTQGETAIGGLHGPTRHFFCAYCLSWLFTRPDGLDSIVSVRTTMLDDPSAYSPYVETYTSEKLPWAATPAVRSFERFPPFEEYENLVQEFQALGSVQ
jgi:hypothetical protein